MLLLLGLGYRSIEAPVEKIIKKATSHYNNVENRIDINEHVLKRNHFKDNEQFEQYKQDINDYFTNKSINPNELLGRDTDTPENNMFDNTRIEDKNKFIDHLKNLKTKYLTEGTTLSIAQEAHKSATPTPKQASAEPTPEPTFDKYGNIIEYTPSGSEDDNLPNPNALTSPAKTEKKLSDALKAERTSQTKTDVSVVEQPKKPIFEEKKLDEKLKTLDIKTLKETLIEIQELQSQSINFYDQPTFEKSINTIKSINKKLGTNIPENWNDFYKENFNRNKEELSNLSTKLTSHIDSKEFQQNERKELETVQNELEELKNKIPNSFWGKIVRLFTEGRWSNTVDEEKFLQEIYNAKNNTTSREAKIALGNLKIELENLKKNKGLKPKDPIKLQSSTDQTFNPEQLYADQGGRRGAY